MLSWIIHQACWTSVPTALAGAAVKSPTRNATAREIGVGKKNWESIVKGPLFAMLFSENRNEKRRVPS